MSLYVLIVNGLTNFIIISLFNFKVWNVKIALTKLMKC